METQTQSNPKVTIPANGRVIVEADQYEDSLTDLDEFDCANNNQHRDQPHTTPYSGDRWRSK